MREGEAPSYFNPLEAERLVNLLEGLLHRVPITTGDIGVMAPYRKQVSARMMHRATELVSVLCLLQGYLFEKHRIEGATHGWRCRPYIALL